MAEDSAPTTAVERLEAALKPFLDEAECWPDSDPNFQFSSVRFGPRDLRELAAAAPAALSQLRQRGSGREEIERIVVEAVLSASVDVPENFAERVSMRDRISRIADLLNRSEEDWDKLEDAIATAASFRAGRTLTEEDIAALSLVQQEHDADDEGATEAYHRGLVDGRSEGGGADTAALLEKLDDYRVRLSTERALSRFDALFGVRRGAAHCREVMARFVEQGGDATTANSIRHNWNAAWGEDPGAGVTLDEAEALAAPASLLGEGVVEALAKIANWREECHACDRDMGHPLRDFDDEDWDLVELCARNALRKARTILARVEGDLGKEGNGSRAVPCQEAETPAWNQSAALWRRGMMHAVERLDRVVGPQQKIPRTAKAMRAMLDGVHEELCALVEFQRDHRPQNYEEAFQLCEAELAARFPPSEPSTGRLGHKNPTPESKG